jgi:hypothetical protein
VRDLHVIAFGTLGPISSHIGNYHGLIAVMLLKAFDRLISEDWRLLKESPVRIGANFYVHVGSCCWSSDVLWNGGCLMGEFAGEI